MPKVVPDRTLDIALTALQGEITRIHATEGAPADFASVAPASRGNAVINVGDFSLQDAAAGGRQLVIGAKTSNATSSGLYDHVTVVNDTLQEIVYITTAAPRDAVAGDPLNFLETILNFGDVIQ